MTALSLNTAFPDALSISNDTIALDDSQIQAALNITDTIADPNHQWRAYLNALALAGLTEWIAVRSPDLQINADNSPLLNPKIAHQLPIAANLHVGKFRVCALGTGLDALLTIPTTLLEQPQYRADYYVALEVIEEVGQVTISGFISDSQLRALQHTTASQPDAQGNYEIPFPWLNPDLDEFLLYLRCLGSQPVSVEVSTPIATPVATVAANLKTLKQQVINIGNWLQGTIDEIAQDLSWVLLPALAPATVELRSATIKDRTSPATELEALRTELRQEHDIDIPQTARAACCRIQLGSEAFHKYVVIWDIESTSDPVEIYLLVAIAPVDCQYLPLGLQLQVSVDQETLSTQIADREDSYLFSCFEAVKNEVFAITVSLGDGMALTSHLHY